MDKKEIFENTINEITFVREIMEEAKEKGEDISKYEKRIEELYDRAYKLNDEIYRGL